MDADTIKLLGAFLGFVITVGGSSLVVYREVRNVHRQINSRMDELLELTRKAAHAEGVIEGEGRDPDKEGQKAGRW